jgi:RNA polymerase sigma factor (sigma-70 family)
MSGDSISEATIWSRARDGDGDAFASLFRRHQVRVYQRATSLVSNSHDAEDVTAAAFFELWRKRRTVRVVDGTVLPWLMLTTLNVSRNHRRSVHRYRAVLATLPRGTTIDAGSVAETNIEVQLLGVRLTDALGRVSAIDAALLTLTVLDELSVSDAAATIGLKPGAARMRLHRARLRLQELLISERELDAMPTPEGERA